MKSNIREFCFPATVAEAVGLMTKLKSKALFVAGGTRHPGAIGPSVETVVDLSDLPLRAIKADRAGLRIGALCSLHDLETSPVLAGWAGGVLARTAELGTSALVRRMGTVGGNVVRPHPYNHLPPAFLALDAQAVCAHARGEKVLQFADLLKPEVMRRFGSELLLTEVRVPACTKGWSGSSTRLASSTTDWKAYVNCVVTADLKDGVCRKAAIAVGALLPQAARLARAEAALAGKPAGEAAAREAEAAVLAELEELTGGSPAKAHARRIAAVLVRRALLEIFGAGR